jgi:hypothetical protein
MILPPTQIGIKVYPYGRCELRVFKFKLEWIFRQLQEKIDRGIVKLPWGVTGDKLLPGFFHQFDHY